MLHKNTHHYDKEKFTLPLAGPEKFGLPIQTKCPKKRVFLLIVQDLRRLNWSVRFLGNKVEIAPPESYDRCTIKSSMAVRREEILSANEGWIEKNIDFAKSNLANGSDVLGAKIKPIIEVCDNQRSHDLFRIFRYYWASPYSEYVGRRIKIIVRDASLPGKPVIGIAALGSPIIHIPERDKYIGWNTETRTKNLNFMMDAYVIGALPPYNHLLGGKLVSYLITSHEVRSIYKQKYGSSRYNQLAGIFTTSLYGKSSQYNRLKLNGRLLYQPIGQTKGFGTLHLTNATFSAMNDLLKEQGVIVSNRFGSGPSWRMRVIRNAGELLGFNPDHLLTHSFRRNIYFVPFARNSISFLNGYEKNLKYYRQSVNSVTEYWRQRWYKQRRKNCKVIEDVKRFNRETFSI